jgi:hypothetical protein
MLLEILTAAVVTFTQPVSLTCGSSAVAQTQAVRGPNAMSAVLKASTEDDHAKDTHLCMADYKLEMTRNPDQPQTVDLLLSDNDWERKISIQLSGFSQDGKRVLGMFSEGGTAPLQQVFDYSTDDGSVRLFDLRKLAAHMTAKCLVNAQIVGTTDGGAIVVDLRSGKDCVHSSRWLLNSVNGPLQHLSKPNSVRELYSSTSKPR